MKSGRCDGEGLYVGYTTPGDAGLERNICVG